MTELSINLRVILKTKAKAKAKAKANPKCKMMDNRCPNCPVCQEKPQCPVTLNGYPKNGGNGKLRKCTFSQSNPACLLCVRDYMYHQKEKEKTGFDCFSKCCFIPMRGWETYG